MKILIKQYDSDYIRFLDAYYVSMHTCTLCYEIRTNMIGERNRVYQNILSKAFTLYPCSPHGSQGHGSLYPVPIKSHGQCPLVYWRLDGMRMGWLLMMIMTHSSFPHSHCLLEPVSWINGFVAGEWKPRTPATRWDTLPPQPGIMVCLCMGIVVADDNSHGMGMFSEPFTFGNIFLLIYL